MTRFGSRRGLASLAATTAAAANSNTKKKQVGQNSTSQGVQGLGTMPKWTLMLQGKVIRTRAALGKEITRTEACVLAHSWGLGWMVPIQLTKSTELTNTN